MLFTNNVKVPVWLRSGRIIYPQVEFSMVDKKLPSAVRPGDVVVFESLYSSTAILPLHVGRSASLGARFQPHIVLLLQEYQFLCLLRL
jgi:hypothetical protein